MTTFPDKEIKSHICLGIIQNEYGEVLIIRREENKSKVVKINWAFPGGKIEEGEDIITALTRELLEETGYSVIFKREISQRKHPEFPVYIHYLSGKLASTKQVDYDKSETRDIKWVKPNSLKEDFTTDFDEKVQQFLGIN